MNRRHMLFYSASLFCLPTRERKKIPTSVAFSYEPPMPSETQGAASAKFENIIARFQDKNAIPGVCFTVACRKKLVYTFSRGYANKKDGVPFTPNTKIALASISKVPTAIATLRLLEQKRISLDTPAMQYLQLEDKEAEKQIQHGPYAEITFRHLLQHSAGFGERFNPWSRPEVAAAYKVPLPTTARQNVAYDLHKPLTEKPGVKFEYSNFGYLVLGRLIEDLSGQPYAIYVQKQVLENLGIKGFVMRRSQASRQYSGECHYYEDPPRLYPSVFANDGKKQVPMMYGGAAYEQADACSGWVSDSIDLARMGAAIASNKILNILSGSMMREISRRPAYVGQATQYKGLGLDIEASNDGQYTAFRHGGLVSGASSWFSSNFAGATMTLVMNKGIEGRSLSWEAHQELMDVLCAEDWSKRPNIVERFLD